MSNETLIGTNKEQLKLFYENQMNYQYKKDEKIIKDIIKKMSNQFMITK